jgi:hypothetical protein
MQLMDAQLALQEHSAQLTTLKFLSSLPQVWLVM